MGEAQIKPIKRNNPQKEQTSKPQKNASKTQKKTKKQSPSSTQSKNQSNEVNVRKMADSYNVYIGCNVNYDYMKIDDIEYFRGSGAYHTLKPGIHVVRIRAKGYVEFSTTINVDSDNTYFNFQLTPYRRTY